MIEDSLENPSAVKERSVSPKQKNQKEKEYYYSLKQKFVSSLAKLQSSETRQIALLEIKRIMDKNREPEFIRMYIALMKSLKVEGTSSSTKQHEILIFSYMSEIFKENLIDPLDKPPSRIKTVFRIIEILHLYFVDTTATVQQACARVLLDLGKNVLGTESSSFQMDIETVINLLFNPLGSILKNGVDKGSQSTAAVCINQLVQYWKMNISNTVYRSILKIIYPEILSIALKLNCEYHDFFCTLATMIEIEKLQFFGNKIYQFLSKMLGVINRLHKNNETTNFNSYMCKVNVCLIIEKIGALLQTNPQLKNKLDELDVIPSLEKASRNRIIQVQMAATRAIKVWNGQKMPQITPKSPIKDNRGSFKSLQAARNDLKRKRSTSREEKIHVQKQLNYMKEDLEQMVKGGWGAHKRANNYVKKNTGVGGGNCSKMEKSPDNSKPNKSHKQEIEALRKYIKENSKKHGQQEKFIFYEGKNKRHNIEEKVRKPQQQLERVKSKDGVGKNFKNEEDSLDFQLQENEGEQNVNFSNDPRMPKNPYAEEEQLEIKQDSRVKNRKASHHKTQEYGDLLSISIHQSELKELEQREQELIEWGQSKLQENSKAFEQFEQIKKNQSVPKKMSKFGQPNNGSVNNSLSVDELSNLSSNMFNVLDQNDLEEFISIETKRSKGEPRKNEPYLQKQTKKGGQSNVSLAISQSKYISNPKKSEQEIHNSKPNDQFTLNPNPQPIFNSKLNSYQIESSPHQNDEDQIQQILEFQPNQHQESKYNPMSQIPLGHPKKQRNPYVVEELYQKTVDHERQITGTDKNRDQYSNQRYQQMIKNPPKSHISHTADHPQKTRELKSEISVSEQPQEYDTDDITEQWEKILKYVEDQEYNEAYNLVFEMQDHIYLLRLMLMTQVPLKKLTPANVTKLWEKFLDIYKHRFIDQIFIQMFATANQINGSRGLKCSLSVEETNDLLVELYELSGRSKGKLSFNAAVLYNEVQESINAYRN